MGWKDGLQPASFRGVPFFVNATQGSIGRSKVVHEFPVGDGSSPFPSVDDTGPRARMHRIDAYILSETWLTDAARLMEALDKPGPGTLVHPYLGTFEAEAIDPEVVFTSREGRMARFGLTFLQTAPGFITEARANPEGAAAGAAAELALASGESFNEELELEAVPEWVSESSQSELERVLDELRLSNGQIPGEQALAEFTRLVDEIGEVAVDLARGGELPDRLNAAFLLLEQAVTSKLAALELYLSFDEHRAGVIGFVSSLGKKADSNARAIERLLRECAIARAVEISSVVEWQSYDDAISARDRISTRIDQLLDLAGDDVYQKLQAAKAALYEAVPPAEESLPRIFDLTLASASSSVLIAYQMFGNLKREEEVRSRNRFAWPGLIPQGTVVEVLLDPS